jgi:hypothetical protein
MSKGENMVERCASAISMSDGYTGLWAMPKDKRALYVRRARAVIEALMEPTQEMLMAAWNTEDDSNARDVLDLYAAEFKAMLRTALSQPKEEGEGK